MTPGSIGGSRPGPEDLGGVSPKMGNFSEQAWGDSGKRQHRHTCGFDDPRTGRKITPHTFRHTAAVHLLEAGVEVNVIRGWLGHADLSTTNRYAEINTRAKLAALRTCEPPSPAGESRSELIWRSDETLLNWLSSL